MDAGIVGRVNQTVKIVNLYFISGLGVDKRVFQKLKLSSDFAVHYLKWIQPLKKESITSYAKRLSESIDQSKLFALIGLSFGGMLASEMNQFVKPVKTVIISSAACYTELPWYIRTIRFMPLYKWMPGKLMVKPNRLFYHVIGIKTKDEDLLMRKLLADTDIGLLKWSIDTIVNWHSKPVVQNLLHIHGNADKLLPIKFTRTDYVVEGGEHFMIYSKAEEISAILNEILIEQLSRGLNQSQL
jgi:hypothetical protein